MNFGKNRFVGYAHFFTPPHSAIREFLDLTIRVNIRINNILNLYQWCGLPGPAITLEVAAKHLCLNVHLKQVEWGMKFPLRNLYVKDEVYFYEKIKLALS